MNFTLKKSDLNLKVYIVAAKPTAPGAENDIAVISSVPMTNWLMSPEKPSGIPRNDGDVWIQYSTKGDTKNILKQNSMMIAMITAWQYVDGTWVDRKAVSCQGGVWVDWIKFLYNKGHYYVNFAETGYIGGKVEEGSTSFTLYPMSQRVTKYTKEPYDLTGASSIIVHVVRAIGRDNNSLNSQILKVGTLNVSNGWAIGQAAAETGSNITGEDFMLTLDVSALDGMHYIGLTCDSNENDTCMEVDAIWFE